MKIEKLTDLLEKHLLLKSGDSAGIKILRSASYSYIDIAQTLKRIEEILLQKDKRTKALALAFRGTMHEFGLGAPVDLVKAQEMYKKADEMARAYLAESKLDYYKVHRDFKTIKELRKSIKSDDADASYQSAMRLLNDKKIPINTDAMTMFDIKRLFLGDKNIPINNPKVNYPKVLKLLDEAIKLGHVAAMSIRGYMHSMGIGGDINQVEGTKLLDKAIELEDPIAMNLRACIHFVDKSSDISDSEAIDLYEKAIQLNNADAMYLRVSEPKDYVGKDRLFELLDAAVRGNQVDAICVLALMYHKGIECAVDRGKAAELLEKGIKLGYGKAMEMRAVMLDEDSQLLDPDGAEYSVVRQKAIELYDKAIKLGSDVAMNRRALMHINGSGGPVNYEEADKLIKTLQLKGADISPDIQSFAQQRKMREQIKIAKLNAEPLKWEDNPVQPKSRPR